MRKIEYTEVHTMLAGIGTKSRSEWKYAKWPNGRFELSAAWRPGLMVLWHAEDEKENHYGKCGWWVTLDTWEVV